MAQNATNDKRGFIPLRSLDGKVSFPTRQYEVSANNGTPIFPGDPVTLNAQGNVIRVDTSGVSAAEPAILGIVARCLDSNRKPFTHSQPSRGPFLPSATKGFVEVYDNPDTTFLVNADSALNQPEVGAFVRVTAGAANTAAGISGFSIKMVDTTASAVGSRFRIIGLGPNEDRTAGANNDVEVIAADHEWRRAQKRIGVI